LGSEFNREDLKALQIANQMFHRDADATDGPIFFLLLWSQCRV
jgi:hypothetical protein